MLNHKFKDSGVIWTLATKYGPAHADALRRHGTDVCSYTRAVLRGLVVVAIITAIGAISAVCFADFFIWLGVMIYFGHLIAPHTLASLAALAFLSIAITAVPVLINAGVREFRRWRVKRENDSMEREPSQVTQMYRSWKDKHCFKITFDD